MIRVGIDLGGTNIAAGVVDENCTILATASTPTDPARGADAVLEDMAKAAETALQRAGYTLADCASVGVGSPGSCDSATGSVTRAHNLGWFGVPVVETLRKRLGLPVYLENDANCAALGEVLAGAAKGCKNAVMITLGTGVGGGIVTDGRLYSGHRALGVEIGHTLLVYEGEACTCGRRGCWEAYASATALIRQAGVAARMNPDSALNAGTITGRSVFDAAKAGDEVANAVVDQYIKYVAAGLTDLVNLLYPEKIVLGGGIVGAGDRLLRPLNQYIQDNAFCKGEPSLAEVVPAEMGNDAGIVGAAMLGAC